MAMYHVFFYNDAIDTILHLNVADLTNSFYGGTVDCSSLNLSTTFLRNHHNRLDLMSRKCNFALTHKCALYWINDPNESAKGKLELTLLRVQQRFDIKDLYILFILFLNNVNFTVTVYFSMFLRNVFLLYKFL